MFPTPMPSPVMDPNSSDSQFLLTQPLELKFSLLLKRESEERWPLREMLLRVAPHQDGIMSSEMHLSPSGFPFTNPSQPS